MQEVLDAVGVTLENKIKKRETDRNRTEINELIKDTENGRRIETTDRSLREESRQEIKGTERGRNDRSVHGDHVSDKNGSGRVSEPSGSEQPVVTQNRNNFLYGNRHLELPAGEIGKLKGNIEAIRTLKELEESGEMATPEQKEKLLKFVGWGGLAESLNDTEYREWKDIRISPIGTVNKAIHHGGKSMVPIMRLYALSLQMKSSVPHKLPH